MGVLETFSLKGKVAVMTGGAGLYGRQIAEAMAEAGAKTIMASRGLEKLEETAKTFRNAGLDVTAMSVDQAKESSIRDLLKQVNDTAGKVDVLINNAVLRTMARWDDPLENFAKSMEVNATGIYMMTQVFGEQMASSGNGGSIIMVGSIQGMVGPDFSLYTGATYNGKPMDAPPDYFFHKGGMVNLTRYVAARLGPQGVRCNCISPGGFFNNQSDDFVQRYNARTFANRMANEQDLKGICVFLASDASAYVTGTNIPVDGGYTAK
jgi:NAD(P)-dependent dehydrogenase (short-subunit alcohol dehydrogenase family)